MIARRIGYAVWAVLLSAVTPAAAQAADTNADWLKKPTAQDILGLWPPGALDRGIGGKAVIHCIVTVQGGMRACRVVSETPAGAGFGAAALALTPQFLMRPATHDGQPIESEATIPLNFERPDAQTGSRISGSQMNAPLTVRYLSRLSWVAAPSFADVLEAYPAKARAGAVTGHVTLDCAFTKAGGLNDCSAQREEPKGYGFSAAAKGLKSKFASPADEASLKQLYGARTQILVTFAAETLSSAAPVIGKPQWARLPTADEMVAVIPAKATSANIPTARVVLTCVVAAGGGLADCKVTGETPEGYDFGRATLSLVPKFALSVWTDEGLPTVGGTVQIPIRYNIVDAPPSAKP